MARGFTVTGAAKTGVEDFTTPTTKGATTAAAGAASGQAPLSPQRLKFDKPLLAKKGTELPGKGGGPAGTGSPGSPAGSGLPGFQDPTGGLGDKSKSTPDTTPWGGRGPGKSDLGDGIEGVHDQGDLPKKDYGKDIPDSKGGPGHKTAGHGWGKDPYGQPLLKTPGEHDNGFKAGEKVFNAEVERARSYFKAGVADEIKIKAVIFSGNPKEGTSKITFINKDGSTDTISFDKNGIPVAVKTTKSSKSSGSYPREDVESKETRTAKEVLTDPLLIMTWMKLPAPGEERGDPRVTDPVPVKGSKAASGPKGVGASPAKGGELAAAGAAKPEAKWRFAGKKPGSGVTDPAEWMEGKGSGGTPEFARIKHFEVIDPVEAPGLQGAMAKAQGAAQAGFGPTMTVGSVAGPVQVLAVQDGKQGWAPLKAGDALKNGSLIRVNRSGTADVGFSNLNAAVSQSWTKVHETPANAVYLLEIKK
jgi:hypothetical protein